MVMVHGISKCAVLAFLFKAVHTLNRLIHNGDVHMFKISNRIAFGGLLLILAACAGASQHRQAVADREGDALTVGTVQKEIRIGMSGGQVASVLGSPNIVTTDENRREVWVYDRISTERVYSADSGGISSLILGGGTFGDGGVGGGIGSGYNSRSGAASTSQKTFTVIIKFNEEKTVRDFAYHTSRF